MGRNARRVVITGLGAVTPLGNDMRSSWEQLVAGRGAAGPITAFDTTGKTRGEGKRDFDVYDND